MFESLNSISPMAKSGQVRGLGVSGDKRSLAFPDIPTIAEAGVPGYSAPTWTGLIGPAGLPPADPREAQCGGQSRDPVAGLHRAVQQDRRRVGRRHAQGLCRHDRQGLREVEGRGGALGRQARLRN